MVNYPAVQPAGERLPEGCCISGPPCAPDKEKATLPRFSLVQDSAAALRHLGSKPRCIEPCSKTGRKGGRSSDRIQHKESFGWVDKEEPALSSARKEHVFTGACLQCLFSFTIHLCPNELILATLPASVQQQSETNLGSFP